MLSSVDDRCRGARVAWVDFHFGFQLVGKRLDDAGSQTNLVWFSRIFLPPYAATIHAPRGEQHWASELTDIQRALVRVHIEQREALILVAVAGFSYEERRA